MSEKVQFVILFILSFPLEYISATPEEEAFITVSSTEAPSVS